MPWIRSCLCQQEKKKPTPIISPPLHLLLKNEDLANQGPSHAFRCKTFKKPRLCHLCHQPIFNQGSCCRVCKYVCHKVCESKEAVTRYTDTSWKIHKQNKKLPSQLNRNPDGSKRKNRSKLEISSPMLKATNELDVNENKNEKLIEDEKAKVSLNDATDSAIEKHDARKNVKIVTIETVKSVNNDNYAEIHILGHTHNEAGKDESDVQKMTCSTSYNGFGQALTTQPRSSKNSSSNGFSGTMDLSYVTERIIAISFPSNVSCHSYRQGQRQAGHMLRHKHGNNYMLFNLTEPKRALKIEHKNVKEVGWARNLAPPLENLCSICKDIESWLSGGEHRIAVLHAKSNKDKLGVVVASYMHYSSICGNAEQALDRFSMRKYLDDNIGSISLPSNRRYVDYFAGLLSHNIKINTAPLYLTHVTVLGAPSFQMGGCKAFLKLYQGQIPIYTSGIYSVSKGVDQFTVNVCGENRRGLQLRGDILIKCYHKSEIGREIIFACQFHTCAVSDYTLSFTRQELDVACSDSRFPNDGAIELHFSPGENMRHSTPAPTPAVPYTIIDDPVIRADSPMNVEESDEDDDSDSEDNHTFGPLDGSIYATIAKKPELSPGAVSSPLTVSMDSGISSAGHQQNAHTNASASPPLTTEQPSPLTPDEQHRELDELLSDMMLTVESIPDLKPTPFDNLDNVRYIDDEEEAKIPYHARQDSKPFSYGVNSNAMIHDTAQKLSSPSLVRKTSLKNDSAAKKYDYQSKSIPNFSNNYSSNYSTLNSKYSYNHSNIPGVHQGKRAVTRDPIDDIFTESALNASEPLKCEFREVYYKDETKRYDPLKRSLTEGTIKRNPEKLKVSGSNPYSDSLNFSTHSTYRRDAKSPEIYESYSSNNTNNLTWLQKQQLKLKERREQQLREERLPHESRLLSELKNIQQRRHHHTASLRLDGYTSDTTAFADDDEDYTIPLHINTTGNNRNQKRSPDERNYSTYKHSYSFNNERPFMTVKRAHEKQNQNSDPISALAANPLGQIVRPPSRGAMDSNDTGLLSMVEKKQHMKQNGINHVISSDMVGIEDKSVDINSNDQLDVLEMLIASLSNEGDMNTHNNTAPIACQYREESSWRSNSVNETDSSPNATGTLTRPQTPAFPVHARTPYTNATNSSVQFDLRSEKLPPKSPTTQRKDRPTSPLDFLNGSTSDYSIISQRSQSATGYRSDYSDHHSPKSVPTTPYNGSTSPVTLYYGSRRSSITSNGEPPIEVAPANVKFVRDTSKYWYKPTISREEVINILKTQQPGTFIIRDSNSFPGAYGMALRVATIPQNIQPKSLSPNSDDLIRHYLIEPTSRGVRLKGCPNEPVFTSLSALVYQHSITQMALPCRLVLPERELAHTDIVNNPNQQLLTQGAACNVLYIYTMDMESLTGPQAVRRAVMNVMQMAPLPKTVVVHFKVNGQGITLTDNKRQMFFRKHYPINTISHCGVDPDEKQWTDTPSSSGVRSSNRIFGFVARKPNVKNPDNQCHLFAELEPEQPATAIVNFVNKILTSSGIRPNIL